MKNLYKIFFTTIILFVLIFATNNVYASGFSFDDIKGDAENFINNGNGNGKIKMDEVNGLVESLANILTTIGVVVVLGGLLIIGIKYMLATPEEAAKLKTKLVGLAIAGVVIIGAYGIWTLAYNILNGMTN